MDRRCTSDAGYIAHNRPGTIRAAARQTRLQEETMYIGVGTLIVILIIIIILLLLGVI
jgi:hypothetical protein